MVVKFSHFIDSCLLLDAENYLHLKFSFRYHEDFFRNEIHWGQTKANSFIISVISLEIRLVKLLTNFKGIQRLVWKIMYI